MSAPGLRRYCSDSRRPARPIELAAFFLVAVMAAAGMRTALAGEPSTALRSEARGISLKIQPLLRTQQVAFYLARGFSAEQIVPYARACGFSFAFENRERPLIRYRLLEWAAESAGAVWRFLSPESWDEEWGRAGVPEATRIAFRWAQFPAQQEFARSDWIMGMATLPQRPSGSFRVVARFEEGGNTIEVCVENVACTALE